MDAVFRTSNGRVELNGSNASIQASGKNNLHPGHDDKFVMVWSKASSKNNLQSQS